MDSIPERRRVMGHRHTPFLTTHLTQEGMCHVYESTAFPQETYNT